MRRRDKEKSESERDRLSDQEQVRFKLPVMPHLNQTGQRFM